MEKILLITLLTITNLMPLTLLSGTGAELFQNGDFEDGKTGSWKASTKLTSIVETPYGKSLKLVKLFNSNKYPCIFKVFELDPQKDYEFSFDFQADNVNFGGEVRIEFKKHKHKAIIKSFDACNTTWNKYLQTFRPVDKETQIMIRVWPGKKPGSAMLLDNVSLREAGNLLPPWTRGNINPPYQRGNGVYRFKAEKGKASISCNDRELKINAVSDAKTEFQILTSALKPLTEYELSLQYSLMQDDSIKISVEELDIDRKPVAKITELEPRNDMTSKFKTSTGTVWCKIILNIQNRKGSDFTLKAPVLKQLER